MIDKEAATAIGERIAAYVVCSGMCVHVVWCVCVVCVVCGVHVYSVYMRATWIHGHMYEHH